MQSEETAYETLGVSPEATQAELASAYRKKAFQLHPDRAGSTVEANESMTFLNSQYDLVKGPEQRQSYDESLWAAKQNEFYCRAFDIGGGSFNSFNFADRPDTNAFPSFGSANGARFGSADHFQHFGSDGGPFGSANRARFSSADHFQHFGSADGDPFGSANGARFGSAEHFQHFGSDGGPFGSANGARFGSAEHFQHFGSADGGPFGSAHGAGFGSAEYSQHSASANNTGPGPEFVNLFAADEPNLGARTSARARPAWAFSVPSSPVPDSAAKMPRPSSRPWSWCCFCGVRLRWLLLGAFLSILLLAGGYMMAQGSPKEVLSDFLDFDVDWRSHYQVLNVSSDASSKEIRKAYHIRISQLHPDKTHNDATTNREFQKVIDAYEILSDTIDRCIYDNSWITGNSTRLVACAKVKAQILQAKAEQNWEDFVAEQEASRWKQYWRESMEGTREGEVGSLLPLVQEAVYSIMVIIEDVQMGFARWGGHFKVLVKTLMLRFKLLASLR
ncbi:hypothetical protein VSDG_07644 [Cytospora chrysosperma]|uniref:J domain-containing protein n=1 Tax=Cytospora chrysosperma TaxID=252740 RepID=A0A423VM01_CYTCH|nr:hypothetical protein VSDG_07644 [Valsa sordida]